MNNLQVANPKQNSISSKKIKCVVWDLDNTIWDGVLSENDNIFLKEGIAEIIEHLDSRGILQSISSRNDHNSALDILKKHNLADYFLYPQINWNPKSSSIRKISEELNIDTDTIAFIDDQPFEREEVLFVLPNVRVIDSSLYKEVLKRPDFNPRFITDDSKLRRQLYLNDIKRKQVEESVNISGVDFLSHLDMKLSIYRAGTEDLKRVEELTERTNQLNTTGYTYSYDELNAFCNSTDHLLFIIELEDKYGTYGKVGVVLIEKKNSNWTIKLLLMSCRVMSRGVGGIIITYILNLAKRHNAKLNAEFLPTDKNRMMYVTYKFAGFYELNGQNGISLLQHDLESITPYPNYIKLIVDPE